MQRIKYERKNGPVRDRDYRGRLKLYTNESVIPHIPTEEEIAVLESDGVEYDEDEWIYVWHAMPRTDRMWFENIHTGIRACECFTNNK